MGWYGNGVALPWDGFALGYSGHCKAWACTVLAGFWAVLRLCWPWAVLTVAWAGHGLAYSWLGLVVGSAGRRLGSLCSSLVIV